VLRELPHLYRAFGFFRAEFVYGLAYFSVLEELRRGATARAIRRQRSQILRTIDATDRPSHDKEAFASFLARAVDDALAGRAPCILH
jgi:hypothetical protein